MPSVICVTTNSKKPPPRRMAVLDNIVDFVFQMVGGLEDDKQFGIALNKGGKAISNAIMCWIDRQSDPIWAVIPNLIQNQSHHDNHAQKPAYATVSKDYFRSGKNVKCVTDKPTDDHKLEAAYHLVLWSTLSRKNKVDTAKYLNHLSLILGSKNESEDTAWSHVWCIYKCLACLSWVSFRHTFSIHVKDAEGTELLWLGKVLEPVLEFYIKLATQPPEYEFRTDVLKQSMSKKDVCRFFMAALVCEIESKERNHRKILRSVTNTSKPDDVGILKLMKDEIKDNEKKNAIIRYFDNFHRRWFQNPVELEWLIVDTLRQQNGLIPLVEAEAQKDFLFQQRIDRAHAAQHSNFRDPDEEPEDDISVKDKPLTDNIFIDYEARECDDSSSHQEVKFDAENGDASDDASETTSNITKNIGLSIFFKEDQKHTSPPFRERYSDATDAVTEAFKLVRKRQGKKLDQSSSNHASSNPKVLLQNTKPKAPPATKTPTTGNVAKTAGQHEENAVVMSDRNKCKSKASSSMAAAAVINTTKSGVFTQKIREMERNSVDNGGEQTQMAPLTMKRSDDKTESNRVPDSKMQKTHRPATGSLTKDNSFPSNWTGIGRGKPSARENMGSDDKTKTKRLKTDRPATGPLTKDNNFPLILASNGKAKPSVRDNIQPENRSITKKSDERQSDKPNHQKNTSGSTIRSSPKRRLLFSEYR